MRSEWDAECGVGGALAGWAHDLGKPLQVIESVARRLVEETAGNPRAGELARRIVALSDDALLVVERLLDQDRPTPTRVGRRLALTTILRRAVAVATGLHPGACVRVREPLPRVEIGEAGRLFSVLVNVVDNALRATPAGEPVSIEARSSDRRRADLAIVVTDHGGGIARRAREPDHAAEPAASRLRPRGLGLAECRRQVAVLGGRLTLASVPGRGTCVTIVVPTDPVGPAPDRRGVVSSATRR